MILRVCALMLFFTLSSCEAEHKPPYLLYTANFDVSTVNEAEAIVKKVAKKWDLRVYEKDREQMKFLTQGKDAFFIALYFNEDPIISIGNSGVGEILRVMAIDYGNVPVSDLEKITADFIKAFKDQLNIDRFKKSEESTALVDIESQ